MPAIWVVLGIVLGLTATALFPRTRFGGWIGDVLAGVIGCAFGGWMVATVELSHILQYPLLWHVLFAGGVGTGFLLAVRALAGQRVR